MKKSPVHGRIAGQAPAREARQRKKPRIRQHARSTQHRCRNLTAGKLPFGADGHAQGEKNGKNASPLALMRRAGEPLCRKGPHGLKKMARKSSPEPGPPPRGEKNAMHLPAQGSGRLHRAGKARQAHLYRAKRRLFAPDVLMDGESRCQPARPAPPFPLPEAPSPAGTMPGALAKAPGPHFCATP